MLLDGAIEQMVAKCALQGVGAASDPEASTAGDFLIWGLYEYRGALKYIPPSNRISFL